MKSPLRYHGGKSYLAKRIIELLPDHKSWHLWREPYFGGGSVTFALDPEGVSEAVNDIDGELMNFWRILTNHIWVSEFIRVLSAIPFSEPSFEFANEFHEHGGEDGDFEPLRRAVAFFILSRQSRQGLGKDFATPTVRIRRGMNENVSAWLSAVEGLPEVHERLKRVEIRNMDAIEFIRKYDHEKAVFYLDPPYLHETRSTGGGEYKHEMNVFDHAKLLVILSSPKKPYALMREHASSWSDEQYDELRELFLYELKGRFLLSGYMSEHYQITAKAQGWNCTEIKIPKSSSSKKTKDVMTECVWRNFE